MRSISQSTLISCLLLILISLGEAMRVTPDMHTIMLKDLHTPVDKLGAKSQAILHEGPSKMSGYWSHPVTLAILLGLFLIGPDQLGSVMTLCSLTPDRSAFKVGFSWGLGHSLGMLAICPIFFCLQSASINLDVHVLLTKWEYCGNYFVGMSMVILAIDFVIYESWYQKQRGELKDSANCIDGAAQEDNDEEPQGKLDVQGLIKTLGLEKVQEGLKKTQSGEAEVSAFWPSSRNYQAAVVGGLQGLCCPMAITGILLMDRTNVGSNETLVRSVFAIVFVLVSSIGAACVALGWGALSTYVFASIASPRTVYLGSCAATFLLGLACIVANAGGALHVVDWEGDM